MSAVIEIVVWWCACIGVWMLSLSAYSGQDLVVAIACGLPCALVAVAGRRAIGGAWRPPLAAFQWILAVPASVLADTVRVLALPFSPRRGKAGEFRKLAVDGAGKTARASGRRAAITALLSVTPASYAVDVDPDDGTALVHVVAPSSPVQKQVSR